jgi:hypothetical protein
MTGDRISGNNKGIRFLVGGMFGAGLCFGNLRILGCKKRLASQNNDYGEKSRGEHYGSEKAFFHEGQMYQQPVLKTNTGET